MSKTVLEGELLSAIKDGGAAPPRLSTAEPRRGSKNINVSRRIAELGFNPVDIMTYIAMGNNAALGTDEEIRVFDRLRSATELLSYVAVKPKETVEDEHLGFIPEFIPKRGTNVLELRSDEE